MQCDMNATTITVTMTPDDLDPPERDYLAGSALWGFHIRRHGGQSVVSEQLAGPADLEHWPYLRLSSIATSYAQGYLDGIARPDRPLEDFSSIYVVQGPYYDAGVLAGQEAVREAA